MNIVKTSFSYHRIVILLVTVLMMGGVYALKFINKNEFPDCTVRQGIVVAVCPGATAEQVEQEVTKQLEDYIFTYKDVRKEKTTSTSMSGMSVVQVQLNDEIEDKEEFWAKFKHGVNAFKAQLPRGVVAVMVMDDFGDSSALLIQDLPPTVGLYGSVERPSAHGGERGAHDRDGYAEGPGEHHPRQRPAGTLRPE